VRFDACGHDFSIWEDYSCNSYPKKLCHVPEAQDNCGGIGRLHDECYFALGLEKAIEWHRQVFLHHRLANKKYLSSNGRVVRKQCQN